MKMNAKTSKCLILTTRGLLSALLIDDIRHDMHVNIVTFKPGGVIPFAETHVMEHGIYILEGNCLSS